MVTEAFRKIITNVDSYKNSHHKIFAPGTEFVYSYIESRGGEWDHNLFFGLQMWLKEYLRHRVTMEDVEAGKRFWEAHGEPFNYEGWKYVVEKHGGVLPIQIQAVPEGTVVHTKNVLATIENTDPKCYWLPSFLETAFLRAVWYPTTVATLSWQAKKIIQRYLDQSCDDPAGQISFKLHDFGGRGVSSMESAAIGGCAHIVNFMGTDTGSGLVAAMDYYQADPAETGKNMPAFSVPAAEHSTVCSWGKENEVQFYRHMLKTFAKPGAIVAVVSDTYDLWTAISQHWGKTLKEEVIKSGACIVIRPDSGNPIEVVHKSIELLMEAYGYTVNKKGYRVLPPYIRLIQGDGITIHSIPKILDVLMKHKISAENVSFGMGGGLLQQVNRDTLKFAMKASSVRINGEWHEISKDPVTDPGKASKKGRFALITDNGKWETVPESGNVWRSHLQRVWCNGELLRDQTFADIRAKSNEPVIGLK